MARGPVLRQAETGYRANVEVFARAAAGREAAGAQRLVASRAGPPPTGEPRRGTRLDRGGSATQSLRTVCAPRGLRKRRGCLRRSAADHVAPAPSAVAATASPARASTCTPARAARGLTRPLAGVRGSPRQLWARCCELLVARVVERLTGPGTSRRGPRLHGAAPVEHRRVRDEGQGALRQRPREGAIRAQIQAPRGHHDPARDERRAGACVPAPPPRAPRRAREGERRRATRADVLDGETPARSGSSTRRTRPPSSDDSRRSSSGSWPPCAAATSRRSPPNPRRRRPPRPRRRRSDETAGKNAKARRGRLFWPRRRPPSRDGPRLS